MVRNKSKKLLINKQTLKKMPQISITDFKFIRSGYGHYFVTYTSQITGKEWQCLTNNMPLIDCTKNAENPLKKDLNELKRLCKNN